MSNTISADLIQDTVVNTLEAIAPKRLAMFTQMVRDFSSDAVVVQNGKPLTAQISLTTGSQATKENPSTFNSTGDEIASRPITVDLLSQQFGVLWNSGIKMEQELESNINTLCDAIVAKYIAQLTTANFGAAETFDISGAITADAKDNLYQEIFAKLTTGSKKILVCGSQLYAKGAPVNMQSFDPTKGDRVRGFDGFYECSYLDNTAFKGVLTDGRGVGIIARAPEWSSKLGAAGLSSTNITIDRLGLTVQFNTWADTNTRAEYGTLDVIFGAGKFDTTATKLIGQTASSSASESVSA